MKVVLKEDVRALGRRGEVKEVAVGYARNYLLPRQLAVEATPGNLKLWEAQRQHQAELQLQEESEARALAQRCDGQQLVFQMKSGEQGRLFGSITAKEIIERLQQSLDVTIDKRKLQLDEPLKTVGEHPVKLHLYKGVIATLNITIMAEPPVTDNN